MARREKVIYELVDDDDGRPGAVPVVAGIGGEIYEADLHPARLGAVQELLELLRSCGRRYGDPMTQQEPEPAPEPLVHPPAAAYADLEPEGPPGPLPVRPIPEEVRQQFRNAPEAKVVRKWAQEHRIPVKDTGRIDNRISRAYVRCVLDEDPTALADLLKHPEFRPKEAPDRAARHSPAR